MFDSPNCLWGLFALIPIIALFVNAIRKFRNFNQVKFLAYSSVPSWPRRIFSYSLYTIAITSAVLGLSDPYIMANFKDRTYENIRLIFVVDVSRSMVYAEDVKPNRLEATKKEIKDFYDSLDGLYECAIVPFAGSANPYFCPLTNHRGSFNQMLRDLNWESAPSLGTDLTSAIQSIEDIHIKKDKIDQSGLNIVILFSDGGKEEALATDRLGLIRLTRQIASKNFKFYTVGVGGDVPCPLVERDSKSVVPLVNKEGQQEYSQMDEEILKQLAEIGGGKYYRLSASNELSYDLKNVIAENRKYVSDSTHLEKLSLQPYLFSITVILLLVCLMLNKV